MHKSIIRHAKRANVYKGALCTKNRPHWLSLETFCQGIVTSPLPEKDSIRLVWWANVIINIIAVFEGERGKKIPAFCKGAVVINDSLTLL